MTAQAASRIEAPWEDALDRYLEATQRQQDWTAAAAAAGRQRALALAEMQQAGLTQDRIAWLVGLTRPRVGQMIGSRNPG